MEIFEKITFGKIKHLMKSLWSWGFLPAVWHFARFKTYSLIKETKTKSLDGYNHYLQPKMLHFCNDEIGRIINKA